MTVRFALSIAAIAAVLCFHAPASQAQIYGTAPWCAMINYGTGEVRWECEYRTFEDCVPNVIAGNRGFCNPNPYGPAPAALRTIAPKKHRKHPPRD